MEVDVDTTTEGQQMYEFLLGKFHANFGTVVVAILLVVVFQCKWLCKYPHLANIRTMWWTTHNSETPTLHHSAQKGNIMNKTFYLFILFFRYYYYFRFDRKIDPSPVAGGTLTHTVTVSLEQFPHTWYDIDNGHDWGMYSWRNTPSRA